MAGQHVADGAVLAHRGVERVDGGTRHPEGCRTPSFSSTRTAACTAVIRGMPRSLAASSLRRGENYTSAHAAQEPFGKLSTMWN